MRRCRCYNKAEEHVHDHKLLLEDEDERRIASRDKGRDRGCSSRMSMVMRISRIMMSRRRKRMRIFKDVDNHETNNDEDDSSTVLLRSRLRRRRIMLRMMTSRSSSMIK